FAGLTELLDRVAGSAIDALPVPQQMALDAALLRNGVPEGSVDPRAVGQGLLSLLRAIAVEHPVVVAVDALRWLDASSGRALAFALRRLVDEPLSLLATARMGVRESVPLGLERVLGEARLRRVRIGPLSQGGLHELLRVRLGVNLSRPALLGLHQRTGG